MIRCIVFDCDGTLVNSRSRILQAIKSELKKNDLSVDWKKLEKVLGDASLESTLLQAGIPKKEGKKVVKRIRAHLVKTYSYAHLVPGVKTLERIALPKIIISHNTQDLIRKVLEKNKITFFTDVYGIERGATKQLQVKKIQKKYGYLPNEILYVGDKVIDVKIAKKAKCISVAIAQKASWSSPEELRKASSDFLIENIQDLHMIIKNSAG